MYSSSAEESSDNSLPKNFKPTMPQFPQTALPAPRAHKSYDRTAEVTVTSLGPMRVLGNSDHSNGSDEEKRRMLETRTALPSVVRTQIKDRQYLTDQR